MKIAIAKRAFRSVIAPLAMMAAFGLGLTDVAWGQTITPRIPATFSASPSTPLTFRPAGTVSAGSTGFSPVPGLPAGFQPDDIHIAVIESKDNVVSTMPVGWNLLNAANSGGAHRASLFWRRAAAGDVAPLVTHPGGNSIIARIIGFRGTDRFTLSPFDVANSFTVSPADLTTEAAAITTVTPNTMLVFTAHMADDHTSLGVPAGSAPWALAFFSATALGTDSSIGAYFGLRAAAGAQAAVTATRVGAAAAISHGAQLALRPALTIDKPAGTVQDDVMIASIAARPNTVTITPPTGWMLVLRVNQGAGTTNSLAIYRKVAGASEPARYTWVISASTGAAGGIQSFANVDTVNPIDVGTNLLDGQNTPSGTAHSTPNRTTSVPDTMLVTSHAYGSSGTWTETPLGSMAEGFDTASLTPNAGAGISIAGYRVIQAAAAATGAKTATATAAADTGNAHILALRPRVHHFAVSVAGGAAADTCTAKNITITAQDVFNGTVTNYTGTINITTSTSHGDWSVVTANGVLANGAADDGAATYTFVAADAGVITLALTNTHADDLTVTVQDSTRPSTASTSITINFRGSDFVITNDPIQVAGRNQATTATMRIGSTCGTNTNYTGVKSLKAWIARDASDPGGAAPTIGAVSLPNAAPGANNLMLTFTAGVVNFNLSTTDVGKYVLNLRDDTLTFSTGQVINGSSPTITTRPFALVVSDIRQGATTNPGGTATAGSKFIAAADTFQATVGGYLWNSMADTNVPGGDGVPDVTATLAQITGVGAAPSYRWPTTLSAASPFTPGSGVLGTLSNGVQTGACPTGSPNCFTSGVATPNNLSYNEVGSFTLSVTATNFLNSGIDFTLAAGTALVFDNSTPTPLRNGVVGRFFPDHFTLIPGNTITPACSSGSFTYMGQPNLGYTFAIEARNKTDAITTNYINSPTYNTGTVTMLAENANNGTDLSSRLPAPTGSWSAGSYSFSTTTVTFSRPASPDGPFDSLQIGVSVTDADGPVLASRDMNPTTSGDCVAAANCTGKSIGGATTKVRFGRLTIRNANGSQLVPLPVLIETQYWNGTAFITNTSDSCTSIAASGAGSNVAMNNYTGGLAITVPSPNCKTAISGGGTLSAGRRTLQLAAPGVAGSVDLTVNLGASAIGSNTCLSVGALPTADTAANRAYLQSGSGFTQNPSARATFGVFKGSEEVIFIRENF